MRRLVGIAESHVAPPINMVWLKEGEAMYFSNGKWINVGSKHDNVAYVSDFMYSDLATNNYYRWTAADGTGVMERIENTVLNLNTSTDIIYGDPNVYYLNYIDLSNAKTLVVVATEGEPRFLFNRIENNDSVHIDIPRDAAKYETVVDNGDGSKTFTVNIAAIVEEFGFAHLHAIKGAHWANTTITSIKIGKSTPFLDLEEGDKEGVKIHNSEKLTSGYFFANINNSYGLGYWNSATGGYARTINTQGNVFYYSITAEGVITKESESFDLYKEYKKQGGTKTPTEFVQELIGLIG